MFFTLRYLRDIKGIYSSIGHEDSCLSLELPPERIGDVVLLGDIDTLFCDDNYKEPEEMTWMLSHGCLDESTVPNYASFKYGQIYNDNVYPYN